MPPSLWQLQLLLTGAIGICFLPSSSSCASLHLFDKRRAHLGLLGPLLRAEVGCVRAFASLESFSFIGRRHSAGPVPQRRIAAIEHASSRSALYQIRGGCNIRGQRQWQQRQCGGAGRHAPLHLAGPTSRGVVTLQSLAGPRACPQVPESAGPSDNDGSSERLDHMASSQPAHICLFSRVCRRHSLDVPFACERSRRCAET
jgi:hypothetical protein